MSQIYLRKKKIFALTTEDSLVKKIYKNNYILKQKDQVGILNEVYQKLQIQKCSPHLFLPTQERVSAFRDMILYEDPNLIVLNKQPGYVCQGSSNKDESLYLLGQAYLRQQNLDPEKGPKYFIVHRLDKVTSGVLLIAKNLKYAQILGSLFSTKSNLQKNYIAIVKGMPQVNFGQIAYPIQYNKFKQTQLSQFAANANKKCNTYFKVLGYVQFDKEQNQVSGYLENERSKLNPTLTTHTLLKVRIAEGRKHQIRVHLSQILETPIVMDRKYSQQNRFYELYLMGFNKKSLQHVSFLHCLQICIRNNDAQNNFLELDLKSHETNNKNGFVSQTEHQIEIHANLPPHINQYLQNSYKADQFQHILDKIKEFDF